MTLALGGDCLADVAVLRAQPELFGPVASDPMVSRLAGDAAPGADGGLVTVDIDATIATSCSERNRPCPRGRKPTAISR
jgi:hypothetical protein